jgi:hypothetical protein
VRGATGAIVVRISGKCLAKVDVKTEASDAASSVRDTRRVYSGGDSWNTRELRRRSGFSESDILYRREHRDVFRAVPEAGRLNLTRAPSHQYREVEMSNRISVAHSCDSNSGARRIVPGEDTWLSSRPRRCSGSPPVTHLSCATLHTCRLGLA